MLVKSPYTTLPSARSIRLLLLDGGADEAILSCSHEVIDDISSTPDYYALSYCWGDEKDVAELYCNGESFTVTKNLYAALHRLRQPSKSQYVWADAICINQKDIPERNQQVSIMYLIYYRAFRVYVWLGPSGEDTAEAVEMIRKITRRIYDGSKSTEEIPCWLQNLSLDPKRSSVIRDSYPLVFGDFSRKQWRSFRQFYQADWFFRVWVIQEVQQNLDTWILCGNFEIEWNHVGLSASWAWVNATQDDTTHWRRDGIFPSQSDFENVAIMWYLTLSTRKEAPFLGLLQSARLFQSTDPRDRVFALLRHGLRTEDTWRLAPKSAVSPLNVSSGSSDISMTDLTTG